MIDVGAVREAHGRSRFILVPVGPIAETVIVEAVLVGLRRHVREIALHRAVRFTRRRVITVKAVDLPRNFEKKRVPCRTRSPAKAECGRTGNDAGNGSVQTLCIKHHAKEMDVGGLRLEIPKARLHRQLRVTRPAVFLAVWTIRGNADEIGKEAALRRVLQRGERCVGCLNGSRTLKRRMDKPRLDGLETRLAADIHLHIPETVIGKARMPLFAALASGERVFIMLHGPLLASAGDMLFDMPQKRTTAVDGFIVVQFDNCTRLTFHLDLAPSGDVHAEIVDMDIRSVRHLHNALRLKRLKDAARRCIFRTDKPPRRILFNRRRPLVDALPFAPRVIPFAVAQSVEDDRRIIRPPGAVRYEKHPPVTDELAADLGRTYPRRVRESPGIDRKRVLPPVAEKHFQRIRPLPK